MSIEPLDPIELSDASFFLTACQKGTFTGERDKAIIFTLVDTGTRAQEFLDLNIGDINLISGEIIIRQG